MHEEEHFNIIGSSKYPILTDANRSEILHARVVFTCERKKERRAKDVKERPRRERERET